MYRAKNNQMNSLHAVSAQHRAYDASSKRPTHKSPRDGRAWCLMIALYAVCCYFWTHLLRADCSFNYFLPYSRGFMF